MKKIIFILLSLSTVLFISVSEAKVKSNENALDHIMAVVNEEVITQSEFDHALQLTKTQIADQNMSAPPEKMLRQQVLDQLINKRLQLQIAKQMGITVPETELDSMVEKVAMQNHLSVDELYERLSSEGMTKIDYRNEIRDQLTMQKLQQQDVVSHITITPQEVTRFMQSKAWQNNSAKEYHVNDVLVSLPDAPTTEEVAAAKKRAAAIYAQLKEGEKPAQMLQTEKTGLQENDLGWRKLPEMPSAFVPVIANMKTNEVAAPIQTPNGFHILQLKAMRATDEAQAIPDRKQIENYLLQRKFQEAIQGWVSKLRSQAFIDIAPTTELS